MLSCAAFTRALPRSAVRRRAHTKLCKATSAPDAVKLYDDLAFAIREVSAAPATLKQEASADVMDAMKALKEAGCTPKWGAALDGVLTRRNVLVGELRQVGVKSPEAIATPSVRNDAAFLFSVVAFFSVISVGALLLPLPGDWGPTLAYLAGGVPILVLAIGSTNPSILGFFIDKFSQLFPDYRDRVLRHEAAHFLVGYLLGVPVIEYSLSIGREHTDFVEAKLQRRLFQSQLSDTEVDQLSVISMSGVAAEAQEFEEIMGQTADLIDLQKILNKSANKLSNSQQQNMTRWAVWQAAILLRNKQSELAALMEAMGQGRSIPECIKVIEAAT